MAEKKKFVPYIPADKFLPELTFKAIMVGSILAIVMGAANAYLGLYVGMTVSATIPAVVMALAVLKPFKGNILEINLAKSIAVTGEALAAGIIFTIPALIVLYHPNFTDGRAGWESLGGLDHIAITIIVAMIGGLLGVLFTIPLRKVLIEDLDLPYPEGVASAEVLKATEKGGKGMSYVMGALGIGAVFKLASSDFGFRLWKEKIDGFFRMGDNSAFYPGGLNLSPALLGVGYILSIRIASLVFAGGVIGWIILINIIGTAIGWQDASGLPVNHEWVWQNYTLYVGVGAIVTGGIYTLITLRKPIAKGIKDSMDRGKKTKTGAIEVVERTDRDLPLRLWYFIILAIFMVAAYYIATDNWTVAGVSTGILFVWAFLFTVIAGYLAGVVGSSNNPISGVTVVTLLFTAILLLGLSALGLVDKYVAMTATIIVAAIVCCSAAIAGDSMQELKTAQLLGATPFNIQIARFLGVALAAIFIPFVVISLVEVYGIVFVTPDHPNPLAAPQAVVMATITNGIFEGEMNWAMFFLGVVIAFILIYLDLPVMAVAIGIYLPFPLTLPIMLGGIIKWWADGFAKKSYLQEKNASKEEELSENEMASFKKKKGESEGMGILFASGLIAGEALLGVVIAAIVIANIDLSIIHGIPGGWPGMLVFIYMGFLFMYILVREDVAGKSFSQIQSTSRSVIKDGLNWLKRFGRK